ncbi:MAG TPA: DUF3309 family protein [Candidatus Acidoferrales bacterium]|jgi:hypothetical protein|nr:DUF3309 family protein [Candidatus Acidoferrales bacterium]
MMIFIILPIFIIIALIGSLPVWRHSKDWGFRPIGVISVIILVILVLFWMGRSGHWFHG